MTGGDRITSIDQIRSMTADDIAAAQRAGRIDFDALTREAEAAEAAKAAKVDPIRRAVRDGSMSWQDARNQL